MAKYNTKVLGFGDNVVDLYEHSHMMYPGGNCVNLCAYSKMFGVERAAIWVTLEVMILQNL